MTFTSTKVLELLARDLEAHADAALCRGNGRLWGALDDARMVVLAYKSVLENAQKECA